MSKALESTRAMACTQCGTPYYLPPEVCNGAQYNAKADMWSLGVLAYELCALRYPFAAATLPALVMAIVAGKYTPLPSAGRSAELRGLVYTMLRQRPKDRLSAEQLALRAAPPPPPSPRAAVHPPTTNESPVRKPPHSAASGGGGGGGPSNPQRLRQMRSAYGRAPPAAAAGAAAAGAAG